LSAATESAVAADAVAALHSSNAAADRKGWVMAGSVESVAVYRRNAANCVEMAKEFPKPESKLVLLNMAQAWLRMADLIEKFRDTLGPGSSKVS
jgi:hypothetical protein